MCMNLPKLKYFVFIIVSFIAFSTYSQASIVRQYIDSFKNIAMKEMLEFKIPASITLAQGILESGSGNSRLAKSGNNHFGIKCKKDWTGCQILEDDDALQECFRCYENAEESYKDHSRFLRNNRRYADLFVLDISDYRSWAKGLLDAGYATNRKYAQLLITTIEKYRLTEFDSMVLNGFDPNTIQIKSEAKPTIENKTIVYNNVPSVTIQNETLDEIAKANNKTTKRILKYNDLSNHEQIKPGDVIYLKPKKRKASVYSHRVEDGETMWDISQKYAIRVHSLYKKNMMEYGTEPKLGAVLHLQDNAIGKPDIGEELNEIGRENQETLFNEHIVQAGETQYSIAKKYGLTIDQLKKTNNLTSDNLTLGQKLKISHSNSSNIENNIKTIKHRVNKGETLYSISKLYDVAVEDLKSWNKLEENALSIDQVLEIKKR
jgi:LysM repeat protein